VGTTKEAQVAVAVEMNFPGATVEQYDRVVELMGLTPGGAGPPGAVSHWAAATADGLRVVDVWESKEQYEVFARDQIGPFSQQVGLPGPPEVTYFEVHNHFGPGR
jgi:hypothetical protein